MKRNKNILDTERYFQESHRFYKNAKMALKRATIKYKRYQDPKPVQEASGMGYLAVLKAIDGFLLSAGLPADKLPASVVEYQKALNKYSSKDGKLLSTFNTVYENLHILGYYRGGLNVDMIKAGFDSARFIVERLSGKKV
jgi:hypothetical protein